jgi:hypothetical protein
MPVSGDLEIFGIQEALKEINSFDRVYRRQITTDLQAVAGKTIVSNARSLIPDYPLPGMSRGALIKGRNDTTYRLANVRAGIRTIVAKPGSKARTVQFKRRIPQLGTAYTQPVDFKARPFALLTAQQKDIAGALWDHAGMANKTEFVTNLETYGDGPLPMAPRALAPGVAESMPTVEKEVSIVLDRVSEKLNRNLKMERTR